MRALLNEFVHHFRINLINEALESFHKDEVVAFTLEHEKRFCIAAGLFYQLDMTRCYSHFVEGRIASLGSKTMRTKK